MSAGGGDALMSSAVGWARELRAAGLGVGMSETLDFVRALEVVDLSVRDEVRSASRAIHVRRHDEIEIHDELFEQFWSGLRRLGDSAPGAPRTVELPGGEGSESGPVIVRKSWSAEEVLRRKDFAHMSADELRQAARLIEALALSLERRPTRRFELHVHGTHLAPRPMMRRSMATGGELLDWVWRRRRTEPRSITLLLDVSGSMDAYARVLLRFAHALGRVNRRTETFVFGTRLTRVTKQLRTRRGDEALAAVSAAVADFSGGTRIGGSLRDFNRRWAHRVSPSNSIVIVLSDGWDRGDPALVGSETARLRRNSHRLLWLNPLAGAPGYQPLAAGMAAAARHVDALLPQPPSTTWPRWPASSHHPAGE